VTLIKTLKTSNPKLLISANTKPAKKIIFIDVFNKPAGYSDQGHRED